MTKKDFIRFEYTEVGDTVMIPKRAMDRLLKWLNRQGGLNVILEKKHLGVEKDIRSISRKKV